MAIRKGSARAGGPCYRGGGVSVGRGGGGAVWAATHPGHDDEVALKVLPRELSEDPTFAERFTREAQTLARRSVELDPNYADAFALSAWTLNYAGRPGEARDALDKALRLSPRPPASYVEILGEIRFARRRYADSASAFRRVLDINPDYNRARLWLAAALALSGALEEARWEATELKVASPGVRPQYR